MSSLYGGMKLLSCTCTLLLLLLLYLSWTVALSEEAQGCDEVAQPLIILWLFSSAWGDLSNSKEEREGEMFCFVTL